MKTFLETVRFARPYFSRYWPRFVFGVVLGILFGISNGLVVGGIYTLAHRVANPESVKLAVAEGEKANQTASALREAKRPMSRTNCGAQRSLKAEGATLKQEFLIAIDPWLPLKGRAMDWKQWVGGFLLLPLITLLRGILGYGSSYCLTWSGLRITNDVKTDAFRKISSQSLDYFMKTPTGEMITRIESDTVAINNFLKMGLNDLVKEPTTASSACCLHCHVEVQLEVSRCISMIFTPLCLIPTRLVARKIKDLGRRDFAANVGQSSVTIKSFQNVRIMKAYALEEVHAVQFRKRSSAPPTST